MTHQRIILLDIKPDQIECAISTVKWLQAQPPSQREAVLSFGQFGAFYVRRNKASITVRPC